MKKDKVITFYGKRKDNDIDQDADHIVEEMTGNVFFPDQEAIDRTTAVNDANTIYKDKLEKAIDGSKSDTAAKNTAKENLVVTMRKLGVYINEVADGNLEMLQSTGFQLAANGSPVGPLPVPLNPQMANGVNPGEMNVDVGPVKGAKGYSFKYRIASTGAGSVPVENGGDDATHPWQFKFETASKTQLTGLQSGVRYEVMIAAVGAHPSRNFTAAISRIVQ